MVQNSKRFQKNARSSFDLDEILITASLGVGKEMRVDTPQVTL